MNKNFYLKTAEIYKRKKRLITVLNDVITYLFIIAYILFLIYGFIKKDPAFSRYFSIPLIGFIEVSIFRHFVNSIRPYEKYPELALENPLKKGKSFPSRHTFSAFIISYVFFDFNIYIGVAFLLLSFLLGILRVLSLKHFIKDVTASFAFATLVYIIYII